MIGRWLGPLFEWELNIYSRKIIWRAAIVMGMLFLSCTMLSTVASLYRGGAVRSNQMAKLTSSFSRDFSAFFLQAMLWTVIWVTPIVFASILAIDRERKMVDYLFAAGLTSREIIFGRWFPRLLILIVCIFSTAPIFMISEIYGGVESDKTFRAVLIISSTAVVLSSIAVFASSLARSRREAIAAVYAVLLVILLTPNCIAMILSFLEQTPLVSTASVERISAAVQKLGISLNPLMHLRNMANDGGDANNLSLPYLFCSHFILSAVLMLFALQRFQPDPGGFAIKMFGQMRLFSRRRKVDFGNSPIFVKDWSFAPAGPWSKLLRFVLFYGAIVSFCLPIYGPFLRHWETLWRMFGNWKDADILSYYPNTLFVSFCFTILLILVNSLGAISGEMHRDSWVSLLCTPLTARQIILQKTIASLRPVRDLMMVAIPVFIYFVIKGNAQPLFLLWFVLTIPSVSLLVASVGISLSLICRSSMIATLIGLIVTGLIIAALVWTQNVICTSSGSSRNSTFGIDETMRADMSSLSVICGRLFSIRAGTAPTWTWLQCWFFHFIFVGTGMLLIEVCVSTFSKNTQRSEILE